MFVRMSSFCRFVLPAVCGLLLAEPIHSASGPDFLDASAEISLSLEKVAGFNKSDLLDLSTGEPAKHVTLLPSDLKFFPDGSGQSFLVLNTGLVVWLDQDFSIIDTFQVASSNSLENYLESGDLRDNEGLLGVAFSPDFATSGDFYLHLSPEPKAGVEIWQLQLNDESIDSMWANRELIFQTDKTQVASNPAHLGNHNGGNPSFGPDGLLYIAIGDGGIGGFNYEDNEAQSMDSYWGKILRIDPDGLAPPEIIARGMRNPFTHAWKGRTMLIGDVGGDPGYHWEEINALNLDSADSGEVLNYGWPLLPGPCLESDLDIDCSEFSDPIHGYRKDDSTFIDEDPEATAPAEGTVNRSSIILGPVYGGGAYQGYLDEVLIYADLLQGWIRGLYIAADGTIAADKHLLHHHEYIIGFDQAPDDGLYVLSGFGESTSIYRIVAAGAPESDEPDEENGLLIDNPTATFPILLSSTGGFSDLPTLTPSSKAWSYDPQYPLWTDGADKQRFFILPTDSQIDTRDPDSWVFPTGTLIFKHFSYQVGAPDNILRQNIETRVLQKTEGGWNSGVYIWRADGSEADLSDGLPTELLVTPTDDSLPANISYSVPGTSQCITCHNGASDFVLGIEAMQLSGPANQQNQLQAMVDAGIVSHLPDIPWQQIAGVNEIERQARGYLHGNCVHCHSVEGGLGNSLGFSLDHLDTRSILATDSIRSGSGLVDLDNPEGSVLIKMMLGEDGLARMPPLATTVADLEGVQLVLDWISWLKSDQSTSSLDHPATDEVIEFYNEELNHYLITANDPEIEKVDGGGAGSEWRRTGYRFSSWSTLEGAPEEASSVCRFYGTRGVGPDSHFLTAHPHECASVRDNDPAWTIDRQDAFRVFLPEDGRCASGLDPVYRTYNERYAQNDANHRYTVNPIVYESMTALGWRGEGVVMCVPR